MLRSMPYDPVRSLERDVEQPTRRPMIPPIMTIEEQQCRLPAYDTLMSPMDVLQSLSPEPKERDSSTPTSVVCSVGNSTIRRRRTTRRGQTASQELATRTYRPVKNTVKAQKASDDRHGQAGYLQALEDLLVAATDYEPSKLQTKGNGRSSGLRSAKDETYAGVLHLFGKLLEDAYLRAHESGTVDALKQRHRDIIQEAVDMSRQHPKEFQLHRNHILAGTNGAELCAPIGKCGNPELENACGTHVDDLSRAQSKMLTGVPDARSCRVVRRRETWERNLAGRLAAARARRASPALRSRL